jgi:hypothetical protein
MSRALTVDRHDSGLPLAAKSVGVQVLLVGLLAALLALVALGPMPPLTIIMAVGALVGLVAGVWGLNKAIKNPLIPFFGLFGMNILVYIIPKADYLAAGLGLVCGLVYLVRNFEAVRKNPMAFSMLIFVLINVVYFFCYSTDFVVGNIILQNGNVFSGETNKVAAKNIVLYSSICPLISMLTVMNVAQNKKAFKQLQHFFKNYYPYMALMGSLLSLWGVATKAGAMEYGETFALPLLFLFNTCLGTFYKAHITPLHQKLGVLTQALLVVSIFLHANKTTLLGVTLVLTLFVWGLKRTEATWSLRQLITRFTQKPLLVINTMVVMVLIIVVAYAMGFGTVVNERINYFVNGLTNQGTLNVRTSNWSYFFRDWQDKLGAQNILFGFGQAVSRPTIFFISATRHHVYNNNVLVQTLHNAYLEYVYDFGLMALFYYFPTWYMVFKNSLNFLQDKEKRNKILSLSLLASVGFICFYSTMDGIKIQVALFYYIMLFLYLNLSKKDLTYVK